MREHMKLLLQRHIRVLWLIDLEVVTHRLDVARIKQDALIGKILNPYIHAKESNPYGPMEAVCRDGFRLKTRGTSNERQLQRWQLQDGFRLKTRGTSNFHTIARPKTLDGFRLKTRGTSND